MGNSVRKLDTSGWDELQLARLAAQRASIEAFKAFNAAAAAHPLANVLDQPTDASMAASDAPRWIVKTRDFRNGLKEAVVCMVQPDHADALERSIRRDLAALCPRGDSLEREANIDRAVRRAKQQVRHVAKTMAVNSLWTLTYRQPVTDRDTCLRHLDAFRRRVGAVLGEWRYIAALELQERGSWHIHLATHALPLRLTRNGVKVKSWDVMRAIWRSVVGELGGTFNEAKRRKRWGGDGRIKGAGAIAAYIGGYVAKDMRATELNRKRYSTSKGVDVPEAVRITYRGENRMRELIELAFAAVGDRITSAFFDAGRCVFFVESDDSGGSA